MSSMAARMGMPGMSGSPAGERGAIDKARARFDAEALAHLDALYSFALKLTRAREDAEDLVSDTMLRAFQRDRKSVV